MGRSALEFSQENINLYLLRRIGHFDDHLPAVHLGLVDYLCTNIVTSGITLPSSITGRKNPKMIVRFNHLILIKKSKPAIGFQQALNHKHNVWPASVIFVENKAYRTLKCPNQHSRNIFGDLLAFPQNHHVTSDQIRPGYLAVKVDTENRPIQASSNLLYM